MPALVELTQADASSQVSSFDIDAPALMEDGDVLYCWFNVFDNGHTLSGPSGWTDLGQDTVGASTLTGGLFRKVISDASSEPATYEFSWDGPTDKYSAELFCVRGADTADPEEVGSFLTDASSPGTVPWTLTGSTRTTVARWFSTR